VLVYRALTYLLQVVLGLVSYLFWRTEMRRETSADAPGVPPAGSTP